MNSSTRLLNTFKHEPVDRPPVWLMRQAGRYLPEYQALKKKHSTKIMMQTPELACEITLQPVRRFNMDAAILYSDILMIPDAAGQGLEFATGEGPRFSFAIDHAENFKKLNWENLTERLSYVYNAIRLVKNDLGADTPLLGFAGAPFTVACYMISGGPSESFSAVKDLYKRDPGLYTTLLEKITLATAEHLTHQVRNGCAAIQLFDTWAGLLSREDYNTLARPYSQKVFEILNKNNIHTLHFIRNGGALLPCMTEMPSTGLAIDDAHDLARIQKEFGNRFTIQGNFSPDLLLTNPDHIRDIVQKTIYNLPQPQMGYIANLGHGVTQQTPVENVAAFVEAVQTLKF